MLDNFLTSLLLQYSIDYKIKASYGTDTFYGNEPPDKNNLFDVGVYNFIFSQVNNLLSVLQHNHPNKIGVFNKFYIKYGDTLYTDIFDTEMVEENYNSISEFNIIDLNDFIDHVNVQFNNQKINNLMLYSIRFTITQDPITQQIDGVLWKIWFAEN